MSGAKAEEIHITPEWARNNPGVFQMTVGSAFNGSNDWSIRLRNIKHAEYRIDTELHPSTTTDDALRKGEIRRYGTHAYTNGKSSTLTFGYTEFSPYEFEPQFRIRSVERDDAGWVKATQLLYFIRLKDFRKLYAEFSPPKPKKRTLKNKSP